MASSKLAYIAGAITMQLKKKSGYHRHHIIPKHAGGDDSKENLVYLTPAQHALAHLELYEKYGKYEDAQAYNTLCSQWLGDRTIKGYAQSQEHILNRISKIDYIAVSQKLKGRVSPTKGMKFGPPSNETRKKISEATKGRKKDNSSNKMGGARLLHEKGNYRCMCIGCKQPVSPSRLDRHKNCINK